MITSNQRAAARDLFLISALALYTELVVIRWLGAEVRMFAYLKNLTLLAAFLGLGVGMLRANASKLPAVTSWLMAALILLLAFAPQLGLTRLFFPDPALYQWGGSLSSPSLVSAARAVPVLGPAFQWMPDWLVPWAVAGAAFAAGSAIFAIVTALFYSIGRFLGFSIGQVAPPLHAYTVHLLGGLVGVLAQVAIVFQSAPPWVWMVPVVAGLTYFARPRRVAAATLIAAIALGFAAGSDDIIVRWSPYYRVSYTPIAVDGDYALSVDHDYYQDLFNLGPQRDSPRREGPRKYYDLPYLVAPPCGNALIVGAGTGNDVAAALRAGCQRIDAVDIDPVITDVGRSLHPERPYLSDRVTLTVEDGRAFLHQKHAQQAKYDVVVFGLVDSLTSLSVLSSVRLEFFLYTVESFKQALAVLDPDHGVLVVGFSVRWKDWVNQRIFQTLTAAAGYEPVALKPSEYLGSIVYVTGPGLANARKQAAALPYVRDVSSEAAAAGVTIVSDDWPFLYEQPGTFPFVYAMTLLAVVAVAYVAVRRLKIIEPADRFDWPMFLMGAGFLLVTTKNISQLSVLFGGTWLVYTAASAAVLLMGVAANAVVSRRTYGAGWLCAALAGTLLLSYAVPMDRLMSLQLQWRWVAGGLLAAIPVFFSSLMFAVLFSRSRNTASALGANLIGALCGGAIESLSLLTGVRAMALLAIGIYLTAWWWSRANQSRVPVAAVYDGVGP